jgi:hypothetical protein
LHHWLPKPLECPTSVGWGIGPVLPMLCIAGARRTKDPPAHIIQKLRATANNIMMRLICTTAFRKGAAGEG